MCELHRALLKLKENLQSIFVRQLKKKAGELFHCRDSSKFRLESLVLVLKFQFFSLEPFLADFALEAEQGSRTKNEQKNFNTFILCRVELK